MERWRGPYLKASVFSGKREKGHQVTERERRCEGGVFGMWLGYEVAVLEMDEKQTTVQRWESVHGRVFSETHIVMVGLPSGWWVFPGQAWSRQGIGVIQGWGFARWDRGGREWQRCWGYLPKSDYKVGSCNSGWPKGQTTARRRLME